MTNVVLDSSCVLGTPISSLKALHGRGIELSVSGLALGEMAVHFRDYDPRRGEDGRLQRRWKARMRSLSGLLSATLPFAPTHTHLINKLGGKHKTLRLPSFPTWVKDMWTVWNTISATTNQPIAPEIATKVLLMGEYVKETGEDFLETSQEAAGLGPSVGYEAILPKVLDDLIPDPLDDIWLPTAPAAKERFEAHTKMLRFHIDGAHDRTRRRGRSHTENDAIDLNMLHHLADGDLVVLTRDYRFIEAVDRCGTIQAPWVRTVGEVLGGQAPAGQPFGDNARREARRHRQRDHKDLARLDLTAGANGA